MWHAVSLNLMCSREVIGIRLSANTDNLMRSAPYTTSARLQQSQSLTVNTGTEIQSPTTCGVEKNYVPLP
jgi:hypothetical protein